MLAFTSTSVPWILRSDSVTKLFYDAGWHGINVEPSPKWFARIVEQRPRDINLQVAVSETPGEITFYDHPDGGLGTTIESIADQHQAQHNIQKKNLSLEPSRSGRFATNMRLTIFISSRSTSKAPKEAPCEAWIFKNIVPGSFVLKVTFRCGPIYRCTESGTITFWIPAINSRYRPHKSILCCSRA